MWSKTNNLIRCSYSAAASAGLIESSSMNQHFLPTPQKADEKLDRRKRFENKNNPPARSQNIVPIVDFQNQSVEVCKSERIRRSIVIRNEPLWRYMYSDARTVAEAFRRGKEVSGDGPCLGYRLKAPDGFISGYNWLSYSQVLERSENFARGLLFNGARPGQNTLIGIYSRNRPEAVIAEQACYFFSMVVVSLYDTLGPDACRCILDKTELEIIICDKSSRAINLVEQKRALANCQLKSIVLMEEPSDDLRSAAYDAGVALITFSDLENQGAQARNRMPPISPQLPRPIDLATICYTSGTSGNPKGAMITHENIMAATTASHMLRNCRVRPGDVMLSFLPMAHMYERLAQVIFYSAGGCVGFSRGDIKYLADDIRALRPHMLPTVPRLLNRIYDNIMREVGGNVMKKWLLNLAIQSKIADLRKASAESLKNVEGLKLRNDTLWDNLVFKKLQDQMGGRVKLLLSGSAPMSREVIHLIRAGMGAMVLEGYGATETAAATCLTMEGDVESDHVGVPVPCNEIKLADVVEMNILAKDGKGEVCVRGHNVFAGYFKDAENTLKAFDKDGWFRTGDIGVWNPNGTLSLLDRKKYIVKLDQGEYVTPEKIENVYNRTQFVAQSFVHGNSAKPFLVGVVVPEPEVLAKTAEKLGIKNVPVEKLCKNEKIVKMIHDDMMLEGHRAGLQTFEQVKRILISCEPFTVENGLLTPTLKSRRNALKDKFKAALEKLYDY